MLTLLTAFITPLPPRREPPSRNSTASFSPVEAPDGTSALPTTPFERVTKTSTVGLPRESKISSACTFSITDLSIKKILLKFVAKNTN